VVHGTDEDLLTPLLLALATTTSRLFLPVAIAVMSI
jgi:hypothetical protein